jgi:hypothetical protein
LRKPEGAAAPGTRPPAKPPAAPLVPFPAERVRAYPISTRVDNVCNGTPDLLTPLDPA